MRKTNKNAVLLFVLLLLVAVSAMMVASTYAKYTAEVTGSGTATVAKWAFDDDNDGITQMQVELEGTVDPSTLADGKIAPGTSGNFIVQLSNENSEVGVNFTMSFDDVDFPKNIVVNSGNDITGQIAVGETLEVKVPWEWAYYVDAAEDAEDTTDGKTAVTAPDLTLDFTITGVQTQPGAQITSHVD